ncbi:MAG: hypothetical protein G3M70_05555 [Candidatus Nitronauta litoralis]|uniref:Uncharacterized protein n=1 Tax=Candidatus Nitronauta litoralis TaxID=2705533 RepID=A0A7T0G022_9BACT|nr:MAG: hypothetical protein G3M70_05555 [Candidatus Nitronauta litoralis]
MNFLKKLAQIILAASFIAILLISFEVVIFSRIEKLATYLGFILSVLFLLLSGGGGPPTGKSSKVNFQSYWLGGD